MNWAFAPREPNPPHPPCLYARQLVTSIHTSSRRTQFDLIMMAEQRKLTMFADNGRVVRTLRFPSELRGICRAADGAPNRFKRLPGRAKMALNRINGKKETSENMELTLRKSSNVCSRMHECPSHASIFETGHRSDERTAGRAEMELHEALPCASGELSASCRKNRSPVFWFKNIAPY